MEHSYINSGSHEFDSDCAICGGKWRDAIHPKSLYHSLVGAAVPIASHESDLYFPVTEQTKAILAKFPDKQSIAKQFTNQVEGGMWFDVPFAFMTYWDKRQPVRA